MILSDFNRSLADCTRQPIELFVQSFVQWDGAANGNRVAVNSTGAGLTAAAELLTVQPLPRYWAGYWLYRSNEKRGLTGIFRWSNSIKTVHFNPAMW